MKSISFSYALVATGLLTLALALVSSLLTIPWVNLAVVAEHGPSVIAPMSALAATIVVGVATLCLGLWQVRRGGAKQGLTFPQALVVVGLLGLGIAGALSLWPAFFMSVSEWWDDSGPSRAHPVLHSLPHYRVLFLGFPPPPSYTGMLVMQLVAVAIPLGVLGEGLRRLLRGRKAEGPARDGLAWSQVVIVLALLSFITTCAAAPPSIDSIDFAVSLDGGWGNASLVVAHLVALGVGWAVPIGILFLVAVGHRWGSGHAAVWLPVGTALLLLALAGATAASSANTAQAAAGLPWVQYLHLTVVGVALAGLVWAALVCSASGGEADGLLSWGQVLGLIAVVGLMLLGSATRGAVNTFETGRLVGLTHVWLIVTLAIGYAINLGLLVFAIWRLRAGSGQEPDPEREGA